MKRQLEELRASALQELQAIKNTAELESWRVKYLGKKGPLTGILRGLATLPLEERKIVGADANQIKNLLADSLKQKEQSLRQISLTADTTKATVDITLPGRPYPAGHLHPITQTLAEICDIFVSMGFQILEGPDVEWDYYNF